MIGETVTHYRILEKLGEGGMGVVYRAEDTRLGRQVAIKFLSAKHARDPLALERFQREARAASSLNHPHICAVFDVGRRDDVPFLVMELLEGTTLRRKIGGAPLPLEVMLDWAAQMVDALDAAHALGIIHRDVKSANVIVTERGQLKILDFGLAKLTQHHTDGINPFSDTMLASAPQETETGQTLGTLTSMSPEQARGEDVDARTDLFSTGVVLYEMATGREPFTGKTTALTFDAILRTTPPPPSELNPRVPAELDHIILKALEKDRTMRYQSAAELYADLKRLRRESDASRAHPVVTAATRVISPSEQTASAVSVPAAERSPRRRVLAIGAAAIVVAAIAAAWMLTRGGGTTTIQSVAVLPFSADGSAADTEYLTDGITETLINGLAQLPGIRVSARSVVFKYKGQGAIDPQQVGTALNVEAVVMGRVARRGGRLVIDAELLRVSDGFRIWGDNYNRPPSDLLVVQDQIANEILDNLLPRLSGEDRQRVTRRYTDDAEAYQLYLQGRYNTNKGTIAGYRNAIEYFQRAIQQDPKYALAYAGLADAHLLLGSYWVESLTEAKTAAEQALALDPSLAEAHVALGHIKLALDWDWPAAESEFKQGLTLNPSSALAHNQYAMYLATLGRVPEAIAEVRQALQLDSLSPIVNADLGWYLLFDGQVKPAIDQFRTTIDLDSNSASARRGLGVALSLSGNHKEAVAELRRALVLSENSPVVLGHLGAALARQGAAAEAAQVLKDLEALSQRTYVPATSFAVVYTALGDHGKALDALERGLGEHDFSMPQLKVAPSFAPLRKEPRFQQILEKLRLQ
jgi:serine/threonine-protein kinase